MSDIFEHDCPVGELNINFSTKSLTLVVDEFIEIKQEYLSKKVHFYGVSNLSISEIELVELFDLGVQNFEENQKPKTFEIIFSGSVGKPRIKLAFEYNEFFAEQL
ncbi:hypothetical protein [Flaviaesturariibacter amylovorans]|uniref:hypothetical protein n=1 Tax=Flaviaesturariibacter amylovorans TaxID=1084520 RepID=UPI0031ED4DDE